MKFTFLFNEHGVPYFILKDNNNNIIITNNIVIINNNIVIISMYSLSDLGVSSNLIGSLYWIIIH